MTQADLLLRAGADFSDCGRYRYRLWREWNPQLEAVGFLMLNPSTADATADDPTIRRCLGFARRWDYGRLEVVNIFAYRATDPRELRAAEDPVGPENDEWIERVAAKCARRLVCAWSNWGRLADRAGDVCRVLRRAEVRLLCLGTTKHGHPLHPLYQPADADLVPYEGPP